MCKEHLTIAICAPQKAPQMSFTCGKLHIVAERREVCDKATGKCLCFVGSCGEIQAVSSTQGISLSSVKAIRCAGCTSREEEIGDRRTKEELVDSPLLTRTAIRSPEEMKELEVILKNLWEGKDQCPLHTLSAVEEEAVQVANEPASNIDVNTASKSPTAGPPEEKYDGSVSEEPSPSNSSTKRNKHNNGLGRKVGIETSIWADVKEESPERRHKSPPRIQILRQQQKPVFRSGCKTSTAVLPMMAAAKSFLGDAIVPE
ncbi:hypothetical protein V8C37DRAFT_415449 [Trichoderma ceciliae]